MLPELFRSVEDVWLIWLFSCGVFSLLVYLAIRHQRWRSIIGFWDDEGGASYALPYLMTFPFYLILVCWVIQSTMILIVKIGVMHSAHCAVRSAVVWRSADPARDNENLAREKARDAAVLAIAPYASGYNGHRQVFQYDPVARARDTQAIPASHAYERLYEQMARHSEAKDYLADAAFVRRKFRYASAMTRVRLRAHTNKFSEPLSVQVDFRMPIHIPGTGWVLGRLHPSRMFFYRDVSATATLPLETPESADGKLGIAYDPSRL